MLERRLAVRRVTRGKMEIRNGKLSLDAVVPQRLLRWHPRCEWRRPDAQVARARLHRCGLLGKATAKLLIVI